MSPRPRETSDEELLMAAHRVVTRLGPNLTLADVADEAGVSAATLVQRFGSKRGLLLAFVASASGTTGAQFAQIRDAHPDPIEAIRETVRCYARMAPSPEAVSNGLAFLQMDLSDAEFHRHADLQARATLEELRRLLDAAVAAKRLKPCDTRKLARALNATIGGSMLSWAILREGPADEWMRADVETVLAPLLVSPAAPRPRIRPRRPPRRGRAGRTNTRPSK